VIDPRAAEIAAPSYVHDQFLHWRALTSCPDETMVVFLAYKAAPLFDQSFSNSDFSFFRLTVGMSHGFDFLAPCLRPRRAAGRCACKID
jgi:hypothetical protein